MRPWSKKRAEAWQREQHERFLKQVEQSDYRPETEEEYQDRKWAEYEQFLKTVKKEQ